MFSFIFLQTEYLEPLVGNFETFYFVSDNLISAWLPHVMRLSSRILGMFQRLLVLTVA